MNPRLVQEDETYVLTPKGEDELRSSDTSVSPAEIELLLRLNGTATVADIAAEVRLLARDAVREAFRKLRDAGLIIQDSGKRASGELSILFDAPLTSPTRNAVSAAKSEAAAGVSSIREHGFYVRIARHRAAGTRPASSGPLTAVVIEDETHLARFLAQYLAFEGFTSRMAANRAQVIAELSRLPVPDLVLLDVMLPDADGFEVLLKMRQHPALKAVPIIMLTAIASREAVIKGLAHGADGYITKPFDPEALVKAVRSVVGLPDKSADKRRKLPDEKATYHDGR